MRTLILIMVIAASLVCANLSSAYVPPIEEAAVLTVQRQVPEFKQAQLFITDKGEVTLEQGKYLLFTSDGQISELTVEEWGVIRIETEWGIIIKLEEE